jgi:hypothetical protein
MCSAARRRLNAKFQTVSLTLAASLAAFSFAAPPADAEPFAFQPIGIKRIDLPDKIVSAGWPVFTNDGRHLLFYSTGTGTDRGSTGPGAAAELWITKLDGHGAHCLSCGLANDPPSNGEGETTPFPDGKRLFFGSFDQPGSSEYGVLECEPSVIKCRSREILPVDFSAAQPATIPAGGAVIQPQLNAGGAYAAKLSQDGKYVGFSDIRSDSVETMIVGRLRRSADSYEVTDPRVLNPPAPTSPSDPNIDAWSDSGALYEFKTFTDGGANATYVQSGGPALLNPEVWSVNLKTGERTRLTHHPDYDEDNAESPDGRTLALWSNRTMHMTDWYAGLAPVRDFIDTPAAVMGLGITSSNKRCHGPIWLMPSAGDRHARLAGQPIVNTPAPHVFVTNNLTGWPQWSPDGRRLALNTTDERPNGGFYPSHAPFLLVARLTQQEPAKPLPVVSSRVGSWAVAPADYHPATGYTGTKQFAGPGGGSVTVEYGGNPGILDGAWSETYDDYSEDGSTFINGTISVAGSLLDGGTYDSHLTIAGAHTGSTDVSLTTGGSVHGTSTYDGNTVSGPTATQAAQGACPDLRPKKPALEVKREWLGRHRYRVRVTASVADMGINESMTDTRPVEHAKLRLGAETVHTNRRGIAIVEVRSRHKLRVSAGDTLRRTTIPLGR